MTTLQAHGVCLCLVLLDLAARSWRIKWLLQGVGHRVSFGQAFAVNVIGDAACALTPMRLGGEAARLATMLRAGVPATGAFVAIGYEVLSAWPVIIAVAAVLTWSYAPDWWATAGPGLARGLGEAWPVAIAVVVVSLAIWWVVRGRAGAGNRHIRRPLRRVLVYWRRMPRWPLFAGVPMNLVNILARTAILPVLASTLPSAPPIGPMLLGSFALLYSQLILPTPSGAGAVELGFLAGAAGDLGQRETALLVAWRFYTTGIGVLLGAAFAIHLFGLAALRRLLRRRPVGGPAPSP